MKTILISFLLISFSVTAQWNGSSTANSPICNFTGNQQDMQMVSDNAGGAILTWTDTRNGATKDIYAQRIDANGNLLWNANGIAICTAVNEQYTPKIISDGANGAIITWYDNRIDNNWNIYAQRINANGVVQWTIDGEPICTAAGNQSMQQITSDNFGGAIIAWSDGRNGGPDADIYIQRINPIGTVQFPTNGVAVCTASYFQGSPQLVSDGNNGVIITWNDSRSNDGFADIYLQRVSSTGLVYWPNNGVLICNANNNQNDPKIVADGTGGAIICWFDNRNGNPNIFAQKVNATGLNQWAVNGISVCSASFYQGFQQIISDNSGGAYITWEDRRSGFGSGSDIYAQKINTTGLPQWTVDGIAVCSSALVQKNPQLCLNNSGNVVITWQDDYNNIYAQAVTPTATLLWTINGEIVSNAINVQANPQLVSSANEIIIAWDDTRNSNYDIYASKLLNNGTLSTKSNLFLPTFTIFPNPVNNILTIQNHDSKSIDQVTILDLSGKKVLEQNSNSSTINVEKLQNGMYLLQLFSEGKYSISKFIKN